MSVRETERKKQATARRRVKARGEPLSCVAAVNLTNWIQLARVGDGVIKSTQVTNKGESNYWTKNRVTEEVEGTSCLFIPPIHPLPSFLPGEDGRRAPLALQLPFLF